MADRDARQKRRTEEENAPAAWSKAEKDHLRSLMDEAVQGPGEDVVMEPAEVKKRQGTQRWQGDKTVVTAKRKFPKEQVMSDADIFATQNKLLGAANATLDDDADFLARERAYADAHVPSKDDEKKLAVTGFRGHLGTPMTLRYGQEPSTGTVSSQFMAALKDKVGKAFALAKRTGYNVSKLAGTIGYNAGKQLIDKPVNILLYAAAGYAIWQNWDLLAGVCRDVLTWMRYVTNVAEATKRANGQALEQVKDILPNIPTFTAGTAENPTVALNLLDIPKVAFTNVVNQILGDAAKDPVLKEKTQAALDLIAQTAEVKGLPTTPGELMNVLGEAAYKATDSVVGSALGWMSLLGPKPQLVSNQGGGGYSAAPEWPRRALSLEGPVDDLPSGAF